MTVANHGLEALNLVREADRQSRRGGAGRKRPYDVVLMDLEMPGGWSRRGYRLTSSDGRPDCGARITRGGSGRRVESEYGHRVDWECETGADRSSTFGGHGRWCVRVVMSLSLMTLLSRHQTIRFEQSFAENPGYVSEKGGIGREIGAVRWSPAE